MNDVRTWLADGGATMLALAVLGLGLWFLIAERFLAVGGQIRALQSGRRRPAPAMSERLELGGLRRMGMIRACIVIAPLLGLLGTVTGMIETFTTILHGGYVAEMSVGIRKALLTTQYGLAIAAPALLAERILLRRAEKLALLIRAARRAAEGRR